MKTRSCRARRHVRRIGDGSTESAGKSAETGHQRERRYGTGHTAQGPYNAERRPRVTGGPGCGSRPARRSRRRRNVWTKRPGCCRKRGPERFRAARHCQSNPGGRPSRAPVIRGRRGSAPRPATRALTPTPIEAVDRPPLSMAHGGERAGLQRMNHGTWEAAPGADCRAVTATLETVRTPCSARRRCGPRSRSRSMDAIESPIGHTPHP
jgi:hypothetical protein